MSFFIRFISGLLGVAALFMILIFGIGLAVHVVDHRPGEHLGLLNGVGLVVGIGFAVASSTLLKRSKRMREMELQLMAEALRPKEPAPDGDPPVPPKVPSSDERPRVGEGPGSA